MNAQWMFAEHSRENECSWMIKNPRKIPNSIDFFPYSTKDTWRSGKNIKKFEICFWNDPISRINLIHEISIHEQINAYKKILDN
jgi:hypothetical protein